MRKKSNTEVTKEETKTKKFEWKKRRKSCAK